MKVERTLKEYLTEIEIREYTPRTLRGYRINLNRFIRFLNEETEVRDTEDLSIAEVRQFTKYMVVAGYDKLTYPFLKPSITKVIGGFTMCEKLCA